MGDRIIGTTGMSGAVRMNPTVMPAVNTMNVNTVLIVTAPRSKPSSRRHRIPHARQRSDLPSHFRMNVRREPHHGHFNTRARRIIRPNDGSFDAECRDAISTTLETFDLASAKLTACVEPSPV